MNENRTDDPRRDVAFSFRKEDVALATTVLFNWERYVNVCNGSELTVRVLPSSFETLPRSLTS